VILKFTEGCSTKLSRATVAPEPIKRFVPDDTKIPLCAMPPKEREIKTISEKIHFCINQVL
jgi:hypothetical protein